MRKLFVLLVAAGLALVSASPSSATRTADPAPSSNARSAAGWLNTQVTAQGTVLNGAATAVDYGTTEQAVIAFSAAGLFRGTVDRIEDHLAANVDVAAQVGGVDSPGNLAYLILGAVASGRNPRSFGGTDLVARLQATERTAGPDAGLFGSSDPTYDGAYRQGLALWALHVAGADSDAAAEGWLTGQQCANGAWTSYRASTAVPCPAVDPVNFVGPDTNSTALALLGLKGQNVTPAANAVAWLASVRNASGGWPYLGLATLDADANSTGLVLQALHTVSGGIDANGLAALKTFQVPCSADPLDRGGVAYQPFGGQLTPNGFATVQSLPALAGVTMGQDHDPNSFEALPACSPTPSPNLRFVMAAYQDFLHRQPDGQERDIAAALDARAMTRRGLVDALSTAPARLGTIVQDLYQKTLGRAADQGGLDYWVNRLATGTPVAKVAANFYASPEYYSGIGGGTDTSWVTDLYLKILHRAPDVGGRDYWVSETASKGRYSVAIRFFQSLESAQDRVTGLYQELLGRAPDATGLGYWSARVVVDGDTALAADLTASPEYFDRAQGLYP